MLGHAGRRARRRRVSNMAVKAARAVKPRRRGAGRPCSTSRPRTAAQSYVMEPQVVVHRRRRCWRWPVPSGSSRVRLDMGGQDHFYLETHIAYAVPGEDGDLTVHASTQHPTEVQHHVAHVLGRTRELGRCFRAPHGRRFRRQGKPADDYRGGGCAARAQDGKAREAEAETLGRHACDRQATRHGRHLEGRRAWRRPHRSA
jgi:hypothetical protein